MPKEERDKIGLPPRIIFYTVDQIATMLETSEDTVRKKLLFYSDREPGICPKFKIRAINIMPEGETPEWRVSERAFLGYLKYKGLRFYTRGYV